MPTPGERLAAIRLKTERAKKHIRNLEGEIIAFGMGEPYRIATEIDADTGEKIYRMKVFGGISGEWPLIIGDAVHNLRSALDHLAWQLVEANGSVPNDRTDFPIRKGPTEYENTTKRPKIEGISPGAVGILDSIKPYKGGNDTLWTLHQLDVFDKHRLPIVTALVVDRVTITKAEGGTSRFVARFRREAFLEDGAEVGRMPPPFDDSDKVDFKLSLVVSFVEPKIVEGKAVVQLLNQFCAAVEGVVDLFVPHL